MNKADAREIARRKDTTVGQIRATLRAAYDAGAANEKRGKCNKTFSKAVAFNLFWETFADQDDGTNIADLSIGYTFAATNVLREFGDFWGGWRPPEKEEAALAAGAAYAAH